MKTFLTLGTAAVLLAGITVASAQNPDGRPADEKNVKAQSQERNPNGTTGSSTKMPSPQTSGAAASAGASDPDGRPAEEKNSKAQSQERNPNGTTGGSTKMPSPR